MPQGEGRHAGQRQVHFGYGSGRDVAPEADRFVRENPEFDYPERAAAALQTKADQERTTEVPSAPAPSTATEPPPLEKKPTEAPPQEKKPDWMEEKQDETPPYAPIDWDEDLFAKPTEVAKPTEPIAKPTAKPQAAFRPPPRTGPTQKVAPVPAPGVRIINELEELD